MTAILAHGIQGMATLAPYPAHDHARRAQAAVDANALHLAYDRLSAAQKCRHAAARLQACISQPLVTLGRTFVKKHCRALMPRRTGRVVLAVVILSIAGASSAQGAQRRKQVPGATKHETPPVVFVAEYIRELSAIDQIHASSEQNLTQGTTDEVFANAIYGCTGMQLELGARIDILKGMRLNPPFEKLIPTLIDSYTTEINLFQQLIDISSAMIAGPKPGVDYAKKGADTPKIRAELEYMDRTMFQAVTPVIFLTLVDQKPDSKNHANHLVITRSERGDLLREITAEFGSKLDHKDPSFQVGAAVVLKNALLRKDFAASDDPWE